MAPSQGSGRGSVPAWDRITQRLFGPPRDLADRSLFHRLSLAPFLAWVGLGADGLSSSAYGPQEAFLAIKGHPPLAVFLAVVMVATIAVIALAYSRIIEQFPHGGGGYLVSSKLIGPRAGVVSGSALLVDYVLTITVSIAAAGDALFSFMPPGAAPAKMPVEVSLILLMTLLNIRGARESVMPLVPVFLLFLVTHAALIAGGAWEHVADIPGTASRLGEGLRDSLSSLGVLGVMGLLARAYSMGGGTYTGIEAVSNGLPILRQPRVRTGRRTMLYMATSLAFTAAGLLVGYVLVGVEEEPGKTLNAVLAGRVFGGLPFADALIVATLVSEGALLVVAAQAGFIDGPRVLANMAQDGWAPRRFAALSDRLTTRNGIVMMGAASLLALLYTRGDVGHLVVMYSINVFLTFSMSMFGMLKSAIGSRGHDTRWLRWSFLFGVGLALCSTILVVTAVEKFAEGGWVTILVTGLFVGLCFLIRRHYDSVGLRLGRLDREVVPRDGSHRSPGEVDVAKPTAAILVDGYGGLGVATVEHILKEFGDHFKNLVFITVGAVDSGIFRGHRELAYLRASTKAAVERYVGLAHSRGLPAVGRHSTAIDTIEELERLCLELASEFEDVTFFAGQLVFQHERWYHRLLHNHTAFFLQRRLLEAGLTVVIIPKKVP